MAWTDVDTIKLHLQELTAEGRVVHAFEAIYLEERGKIQLPHQLIMKTSLRVSALLDVLPTGPLTLTLTGTSWYPSGVENLYPRSFVVAEDPYPLQRYRESVDYVVRDEDGSVRRLEGGSIPSGGTVYAWGLPMHLYEMEVDYLVDADAGLLMILPEGSIPPRTRLIIAYETTASGITDTVIQQAIDEVEAKITGRLSDEYGPESSDVELGIGATEWTLATIADDIALRSLLASGDASADDRARRLMELARRYEERAMATLSPFLRAPVPHPATRGANPSPPPVW